MASSKGNLQKQRRTRITPALVVLTAAMLLDCTHAFTPNNVVNFNSNHGHFHGPAHPNTEMTTHPLKVSTTAASIYTTPTAPTSDGINKKINNKKTKKIISVNNSTNNQGQLTETHQIAPPTSRVAPPMNKRNRKSKMKRPKSRNSSPRVGTEQQLHKYINDTVQRKATLATDSLSTKNKKKSQNNNNNKKLSRRLLSKEEEYELVNQIRNLRTAIRIRDELMNEQVDDETLPTEQQWAKACGLSIDHLHQVIDQAQQARTILVECNTGLVITIAKQHYAKLKFGSKVGNGIGSIVSLDDMIQEGTIGLIEAAERFEPERGFRFSTYAAYWIRQRIYKVISDMSRSIRLPANVYSSLNKINRTRRLIREETGKTPSNAELAEYLDMSEAKLERLVGASRNVVSLELPVVTSGGMKEDKRKIGEIMASNAPTPDEAIVIEFLRRDIRAVVDGLADSERNVLLLRFGLDNTIPLTLEGTAKKLGITIDQVRTLESRALNNLRNPQRNYRLREYLTGYESNDNIINSNNGEDGEQLGQDVAVLSVSNNSPDKYWFY